MDTVEHSKAAEAASRIGAPPRPLRTGTPASLSAAGRASEAKIDFCCCERTLTAKVDAFANTGLLREDAAKHHSTRGGVSETDVKELISKPVATPSADRLATNATPVGNWPRAMR